MAVAIKIAGLVKCFDNVRAVDGVSVKIDPGELFFLLGPSGCGKTTLLRCVAGFHQPESGSIHFDKREITYLPPHERDAGMVFQSYALWPHMTLAENVGFGLKMRKRPRTEIRRRVMEALELVHIADRADARPNQLSGGQQQRVALARALVIEPQCLLLDEPLSNLDAKLRLEMRGEIRRICKQAGLTAIYVTHDQKEALSVADRVAVMRAGKIEQFGSPVEIYRHPINRFVAEFIGEGNFVAGKVRELRGNRLLVETPIGLFEAITPLHAPARGATVTLCIRPEALRLDSPPPNCANILNATLRATIYQGEVAHHQLSAAAAQGEMELKAAELNPLMRESAIGQSKRLWIESENILIV